MRQVADECCHCDEHQITQRPQKIFHGMTKRQQEIHVPGQMNDACVKEERCDERQSTERRLRWNQSETLNNQAIVRLGPKTRSVCDALEFPSQAELVTVPLERNFKIP